MLRLNLLNVVRYFLMNISIISLSPFIRHGFVAPPDFIYRILLEVLSIFAVVPQQVQARLYRQHAHLLVLSYAPVRPALHALLVLELSEYVFQPRYLVLIRIIHGSLSLPELVRVLHPLGQLVDRPRDLAVGVDGQDHHHDN